MTFNINEIAPQNGKIAIVTGANSGLGYETTLALAKKGISVVMACRDKGRAETAKNNILKTVPNAELDILLIDLSKLQSVRDFSKSFLNKYNRIDWLINNAGVMIPPYKKTVDGFELQMGANYFGHFLLTALLFECIDKTPKSRIISLSSIAHKSGRIQFDDLHWEKKYDKMKAYSQSKLACLMFSNELHRRLSLKKSKTISVAAHPGISDTELVKHIPKLTYFVLKNTVMNFVSHKPDKGALPIIMAALDSNVESGTYYGPQGFKEMKGSPGLAYATRRSRNEILGNKLWEVSEELTGVKFL